MRQIVKCGWCDWIGYADELDQHEEEIAECECIACKKQCLSEVDYSDSFNDNQLENLWYMLGDILFDEDGSLVLAEEWLGFPKGTDREWIWSWFDQNYSYGVAVLMYGGN